MKFRTNKAICLIAAIAISLSLLTACGDKTPVSSTGFETVAQQKGYIVEDGTDFFSVYDYIKLATLATPSDKAFQIEFYELNDEAVAKSFYDSNKSDFKLIKGPDSNEIIDSGSNYDIYKLEAYGKFMMIERVGNTVIYVHSTDVKNKSKIEAFLTEINY